MSRNVFTRIALPVTAVAAAAMMSASMLQSATAAPASGPKFGLATFGFSATAHAGVTVRSQQDNLWCLKFEQGSQAPGCDVQVAVGFGKFLDPSAEYLGYYLNSSATNKPYCDEATSTEVVSWSSHAQIAGRRGEFRHIKQHYEDGHVDEYAQYTLTNNPSVVIWTSTVSPRSLELMKFVAKNSKVNKTTDAVRGWDEGIVRKVEKRGTTTKVWLDRVAPDGSNVNKQTYVYLVDNATDEKYGHVIKGDELNGRHVTIFTDGRRVIEALVR